MSTHRKHILATEMTSFLDMAGKKVFGVKTTSITIRFFESLWKEVKEYAEQKGHSYNSMVNILCRDRLDQLKKPRFMPYKIIGTTRVVLYDRISDTLIVVNIEEDIDEQYHFLCEEHVGANSCEHIEFVMKIPTIREWIREAKREARF